MDTLTSRAISAYFRTCAQQGTIPDQPTGGNSVTEHNGKTYIVLENGHRTIAVYRVRNDGVLKRLRRWPAELTASIQERG